MTILSTCKCFYFMWEDTFDLFLQLILWEHSKLQRIRLTVKWILCTQEDKKCLDYISSAMKQHFGAMIAFVLST